MVALFCLPGISFAEKIIVYSAVYPPYQIDHNGKLTGINTEIVRAIFQYSDVLFEIKYVPWSRAQKYVGDDSQKNSAIYCLGRNEQREQKYKWVGVYFYQKVSLWKNVEAQGLSRIFLHIEDSIIIGPLDGSHTHSAQTEWPQHYGETSLLTHKQIFRILPPQEQESEFLSFSCPSVLTNGRWN